MNFELLIAQLAGDENLRKATAVMVEKAMLPYVTSIRTYVKGKLVMELHPQ